MEKFGQYTIEETLGSGDMGTTYKATHPDQLVPVALKVLDKVDTSNSMKRGTALELLEFATSLSHPCLQPILEVIEIEEEDGTGYLGLAMPLASGGSFGDLIDDGRTLKPKQAFKMIAQVASALEYLHNMEVAHGSIKPNNILMDSDGNFTLTDLAMSHMRDLGFVPDAPSEQHEYFMAPEREYHAVPEVVGDVFSLGVLTYLALQGELPFSDPVPEARDPVAPGDLPGAVASVLRRELNPQVRHRYDTLPEFMVALREANRGHLDQHTERLFGAVKSELEEAYEESILGEEAAEG